MKAKSSKVIDMVIENAVEYGWSRAHKHNSDPTPEFIKECIKDAIEIEIYEWFEFPDLKD